MYKGKVEGRTLLLSSRKFEDEILNCCSQMSFHAKEKEQIIIYEPQFRRLGIKVNDNVFQVINFCPWCSKRLPKVLCDEWWDILEKEYNMTDTSFDDPDLPEEFKTDEWWKKRGL